MASDDLARRTAQRLGPEFDSTLPALVEAQLQAGGQPLERYDPGTAIALAALLLNAAKFAWDIYRDREKDAKAPPPPDSLARQLRLELKVDAGVSTEARDKVISAVVAELTKAS
ncbi:hypothetical protein [Methylobacterium oxalidis]|uniref:hypothetical protein n=1 Tax=Methylobacterium oxalidis TaxID=944322 RepID=UPI003314A11A